LKPHFTFTTKEKGKERLNIALNGVEFEDIYCTHFIKGHYIHASNDTFTQLIEKHTIQEISEEIDFLRLDIHSNFENCNSAEIKININTPREPVPCIIFNQTVFMETWKGAYSFSDFIREFKNECLNHQEVSYYQEDEEEDLPPLNGFGLKIDIGDHHITIKEYAKQLKDKFDTINKKTAVRLDTSPGLTFNFHFPPSIATVCEQYLLYFSQFMLDLGIQIEESISHNASKTFLSITPTDKNQALSTIHNALSIYLQLPNLTMPPPYSGMSTAASQLTANVLHLQSQLTLVSATLETKNATIAALQTALELTREKNINPKEPEKLDSHLGEIIKLKKYEGKILSIDIPALLKLLKRKI